MSTIGDNVLNMANLVRDVAKITKLDPMLVYRILELNVAYMSREAKEIVEPSDDELNETDYANGSFPLAVLDGGKTEDDNASD